MALNRSPEFCLKLKNRYLLKAGHFPGDTRGSHFWRQGHNLNKLDRNPLVGATCHISMFQAFQTRRFISVFPVKTFVKHVTLGRGYFLAPAA